MADLGGLASQYFRTSQAAAVIDQAVEELHESPVGEVNENNNDLGLYIATLAGLIDPARADRIDPKFANTVPSSLVMNLGQRQQSDPALSQRLVDVADALLESRKLDEQQVRLMENVASVATEEAARLSQELLE